MNKMKKIFFITSMIASGLTCASAQTFYVEPTPKGYEKHITQKLQEKGYKLTDDKAKSDYALFCLLNQSSKMDTVYSGYLSFEDSKNGEEIGKTVEVKKEDLMAAPQDTGQAIFQSIADKYLIKEVKRIKKFHKKKAV